MEQRALRLTELSHGAGCGCKIAPDRLGEVLRSVPASRDPDLLIGRELADDAAVYRIGPDQAIVHTADFFTPIVDDPYDFGRIAAANALSDVYAMGGRPLLALNLVAFPLDELGPEVLGRILAGGQAVVEEAGAVIGGGHSIEDREPKYGLAVTGLVDPARMLANSGARPGDVLVLTKPLGAGLVSTAAKRDRADAGLIARAVEVMTTLNAAASAQAVAAGASAATDVTGFGLVGHAHELALASGVSVRIDAAAVPCIDGALELAADPDCIAGGTRRNARHAAAFTSFGDRVDPLSRGPLRRRDDVGRIADRRRGQPGGRDRGPGDRRGAGRRPGHDRGRIARPVNAPDELAPGLWSWARRHPEWHPGEFGAEVVSFLARGGEGDGETLLIDPLLGGGEDPAWELIEAQAGERIRVLITITYHVRSAESVRDRFGDRVPVTIHGHEAVAKRLASTAGFEAFAAGDRLPAGVTAHPVGRPRRFETPLLLPSQRALVFGDALVGTADGPRIWAQERIDERVAALQPRSGSGPRSNRCSSSTSTAC